MLRNCSKYKTEHKKSEKAQFLAWKVSSFKRYQLHLASLLNDFMTLAYFIAPGPDRKPLKSLSFRVDLTRLKLENLEFEFYFGICFINLPSCLRRCRTI